MSPYDQALGTALKRLHTSDRFVAEIRTLLHEKGFDEETVDAVLQFLIQRRVLDDQRTTKQTLERYSGKRSIGKEKIRAELLRRGAPEETIEECLAELVDDDELGKMVVALEARLKRTDSRAKGGRFLLSRGFSEDLVEQALDRFFGHRDLAD